MCSLPLSNPLNYFDGFSIMVQKTNQVALEDGCLCLVKMCTTSYPPGSHSGPTFGLTREVKRKSLAKIGDCLSVLVYQCTRSYLYIFFGQMHLPILSAADFNSKLYINYRRQTLARFLLDTE